MDSKKYIKVLLVLSLLALSIIFIPDVTATHSCPTCGDYCSGSTAVDQWCSCRDTSCKTWSAAPCTSWSAAPCIKTDYWCPCNGPSWGPPNWQCSCPTYFCVEYGPRTCQAYGSPSCTEYNHECGCANSQSNCGSPYWECSGGKLSSTAYHHTVGCEGAGTCFDRRSGSTNSCSASAWGCGGGVWGRTVCSCNSGSGTSLNVPESYNCNVFDGWYCRTGNDKQYNDFICGSSPGSADAGSGNCNNQYVGQNVNCPSVTTDIFTEAVGVPDNPFVRGQIYDYTSCGGSGGSGPGGTCNPSQAWTCCNHNDYTDSCSGNPSNLLTDYYPNGAGYSWRSGTTAPPGAGNTWSCNNYQTCTDTDNTPRTITDGTTVTNDEPTARSAANVNGNDLTSCNGACDLTAYNKPDSCDGYILTEYMCNVEPRTPDIPYHTFWKDCRDYDTPATGYDLDDSPTVAGTCTNGDMTTCGSYNGVLPCNPWYADCRPGNCNVDRTKQVYSEGCYNRPFTYIDGTSLSNTCGIAVDSCKYVEYFSGNFNCGGAVERCLYKTYDADTNSNTCLSGDICGTWTFSGEGWYAGAPASAQPGEFTGFGAAGSVVDGGRGCCGDDPSEVQRYKQGVGGDDLGNKYCCKSAIDCLYQNKCYDDIDSYSISKTITRPQVYSQADKDRVYQNVGGDGRLEVCLGTTSQPNSPSGTGIWVTPTGTIQGTVRDVNNNPVANAEVRILGTTNYTYTNAAGAYSIPGVNSTAGNADLKYDMVAKKDPMTDHTLRDIFLPDFGSVSVDFVLGFGSTSCEPDCTFTNDETCHATCQGTNGCSFFDDPAKGACDREHIDFRRPYGAGQEVQCCEGAPYTPAKVKATTQINATTVVRVTRNVWYEGKLVKMVIDVFSPT